MPLISRNFWQLFPLFRLALFFIVGIFAGMEWQIWMQLSFWGLIISLLGAYLLIKYRYISSLLIFFAAFCGGVLLISETLTLQRNKKEALLHSTPPYRAVVVSTPQAKGKVFSMDLYLLDYNTKVRASFLAPCETLPALGTGVIIHSALKLPENRVNNLHFDYVRWLSSQGICATTFILPYQWQGATLDISNVSRIQRTRWRLQRWRELFLDKLQSYFSNSDAFGLIAAISLGDKAALGTELKANYSTAGGAHILALSGFHLATIYAVLFFLCSFVSNPFIKQIVCLSCIWLYVFAVGLSPSVMRSALMLTCYGVFSLAFHHRATVNQLGFAAIIMLLFAPFSLWDVGFQLSFLAVLSICVYFPVFYSFFTFRHKIVRYLWGVFCVSLAAQIGTSPLVVYYFGQFPVYFFITSFVLVPLSVITLYMVFATFVLYTVPYIGGVCLKCTEYLAIAMNESVRFVAHLPGADSGAVQLSALQTVLIYLFIIISTLLIMKLYRIVHNEGKLEWDE